MKNRQERISWTTQQMEKSTIRCFRSPCEKEGKTSWRSPKNVGQVGLGFKHLGFWYLRFWIPRFRPKDVGELL
jgi:hypothetical protein